MSCRYLSNSKSTVAYNKFLGLSCTATFQYANKIENLNYMKFRSPELHSTIKCSKVVSPSSIHKSYSLPVMSSTIGISLKLLCCIFWIYTLVLQHHLLGRHPHMNFWAHESASSLYRAGIHKSFSSSKTFMVVLYLSLVK